MIETGEKSAGATVPVVYRANNCTALFWLVLTTPER